jgi:hypothetical protein
MALLDGSPAIDAGDNTDAPEWDQRGEGFSRIAGKNIDIGAYEVQDDGGRVASPHAKPVHPDVVALVGIPPSQRPLGQIASEATRAVAAVDTVFANESWVQPAMVIVRPAMVDDLTPLTTHKESHQDWTQVDDWNLFPPVLG